MGSDGLQAGDDTLYSGGGKPGGDEPIGPKEIQGALFSKWKT